MNEPSTPMPSDQPAASPHPVMPTADTTNQERETSQRLQMGRKQRRNLLAAAAIGIVVLLTAVGIGLAVSQGSGDSDGTPKAKEATFLEEAREGCGDSALPYAELGDEGRTLTLRSSGKEDAGLTWAQLECFWTALEVPDSIRAEIETTRALDGRQTGEWNGKRASWTYHPDNGLRMVVTLTD
ncbi:hypothetical protein RM555_25215 [Micromonospora sp. DSM 115977]|uniref:Uncharacterized protein n=1 Tax=Micromonospora reichwaldensis TaxID=3075516 RepID=A0ABU2X284_9ACTN|nr:hypothetical protein [Micromonospora sp. DSM 115977]MDT0532305.1 hypothetical protein [Micromonospora sp. DSM 115977]